MLWRETNEMIKAHWQIVAILEKYKNIYTRYKLLYVGNQCSFKYMSQRFKYLPFLDLLGKT